MITTTVATDALFMWHVKIVLWVTSNISLSNLAWPGIEIIKSLWKYDSLEMNTMLIEIAVFNISQGPFYLQSVAQIKARISNYIVHFM